MPKQCIFCGQLGGNREHIVGKWILNALDLYTAKTQLGFARETGEPKEIYEPCHLGGCVTDSVCQSCNNGWMSRLESEVKPLLSPLMVDPWPTNDRHLLSSLFLNSHVITMWLLKTACTLGDKMSCEVPDYVRSDLYKGCLHGEIMADISCNDVCGFYAAIRRSWKGICANKIDEMSVPGHSFRFFMQLEHLAMRVSYFPNCIKIIRPPRCPVQLYPKFRIPPDLMVNAFTTRAYWYPSPNDLENDTFYAPMITERSA